MATFYGTQRSDDIEGTIFADTIYGWAQGGDPNRDLGDHLDGNNGNNRIYGGGGNDILQDGRRDDLLNGGIGSDSLYSGGGDDLLYGESGNDYLFDYSGDDLLAGGRGDDTLRAGDGNDSLYGGSGDDLIIGFGAYGFVGRDMLVGGIGRDTLYSGVGFDTLVGGEGSDTFVFTGAARLSAHRFDVLEDFNGAQDRINVSRSFLDADFALGTLSENDFFMGQTPSTSARGSDDAFVYDTDDGRLFFDANGQAAGGLTLIATLTGAPELSADDLIISNLPSPT